MVNSANTPSNVSVYDVSSKSDPKKKSERRVGTRSHVSTKILLLLFFDAQNIDLNLSNHTTHNIIFQHVLQPNERPAASLY